MENMQNRFDWIFIMKIFLKMDKKTYLKEPQNDQVWSEWKYYFLKFQMFVFSLEYAEEHQQRSSDLSLVNEKIRLK